jgi:hypothetical protein
MLALDPYYEMFPTTYRRSYPDWRYFGAAPTANAVTVSPTRDRPTELSREQKIAGAIAVALGLAGIVVLAWRGIGPARPVYVRHRK